jgi:hypothetical protein
MSLGSVLGRPARIVRSGGVRLALLGGAVGLLAACSPPPPSTIYGTSTPSFPDGIQQSAQPYVCSLGGGDVTVKVTVTGADTNTRVDINAGIGDPNDPDTLFDPTSFDDLGPGSGLGDTVEVTSVVPLPVGTCTTILITSSQYFDFSPGAGKPFRWAVTF